MAKSSCCESSSTFELVPPPDSRYTDPREKPTSDDYIKRVYECEEEGHRNTAYWEQRQYHAVSSRPKSRELSSTVRRDLF